MTKPQTTPEEIIKLLRAREKEADRLIRFVSFRCSRRNPRTQPKGATMTHYKAGDEITIKLNDSLAANINKGWSHILNNILSHKPAPEPIVKFLNVYEKRTTAVHDTPHDANISACSDRLACLKITYDPATNTASAEVV